MLTNDQPSDQVSRFASNLVSIDDNFEEFTGCSFNGRESEAVVVVIENFQDDQYDQLINQITRASRLLIIATKQDVLDDLMRKSVEFSLAQVMVNLSGETLSESSDSDYNPNEMQVINDRYGNHIHAE